MYKIRNPPDHVKMIAELTTELEKERLRADRMTEALIIQRQIHGEAQFNTEALNLFRKTLSSLLIVSGLPTMARIKIEDVLEWEQLNR